MKNFKKGDKVKVFNSTLSGERFLEGIAIVDKKCEYGESFYSVRFVSTSFYLERNLNDAEKVEG